MSEFGEKIAANHYLSVDLEYGFAAIRDRPNRGNLHFVQTRFQFDFF